ncbi:hypothetical protein CLOM_g1098, partial [Closterium sp. NIES-68]
LITPNYALFYTALPDSYLGAQRRLLAAADDYAAAVQVLLMLALQVSVLLALMQLVSVPVLVPVLVLVGRAWRGRMWLGMW